MECLTNIIGVTEDLCDCLKNELTEDQITAMGASNSGLFIDRLPGGLDLKALQNVDICKNLATLSLNAIDSAIKAVEADLVVALNNEYQKGVKTFKGIIGQLAYTGVLNPTKRYQAFLIRANDGADAVMQINKIGLLVNQAVTTNVLLYSAPRATAVGAQVATFEVTTIANTIVYITPPGGKIILPLSYRGQAIDYYLIYDSQDAGGFAPKDNKIFCNCPTIEHDKRAIAGYVQLMGMELDDLDNFSAGVVDKKYTRGFILDAQLRCNNEQLVCGQYDANEAISIVLAYATWFKAGELIIENVMQTREINRYTMQNKEYLWGKRNHFITEYQNRIAYLVKSIDTSASNCFVCRNDDIYMSTAVVTDGGQQNVYDTEIAMNAADFTGLNPGLSSQQKMPGTIDYPANY